jgi:hypothetical protein
MATSADKHEESVAYLKKFVAKESLQFAPPLNTVASEHPDTPPGINRMIRAILDAVEDPPSPMTTSRFTGIQRLTVTHTDSPFNRKFTCELKFVKNCSGIHATRRFPFRWSRVSTVFKRVRERVHYFTYRKLLADIDFHFPNYFLPFRNFREFRKGRVGVSPHRRSSKVVQRLLQYFVDQARHPVAPNHHVCGLLVQLLFEGAESRHR